MKKTLILFFTIFLLLVGLCFNISAEEEYETLKNANGNVVNYYGSSNPIKIRKNYYERTEELRATWCSFYAGDITTYTTDDQMKAQLLQVLETLEYYNMNAIVFHIRTHNDAMYKTDLAPQSPYTKNADYDKFDYLTWFIDECHKRGIEFHAWLNPYRIFASGGTEEEIFGKYMDYPKNPAHDMSNVLMNNSGAAILDPGIPEVRQYIIDTCIEIMDNYDVDAIHFDDYFYINDVDDSATRKKYNKDNLSLDNFRRTQVDIFIQELSEAMFAYNTEHNRAVQLGISPTAVYRNFTSYVDPKNYKYDANGTLTSPYGSSTSAWQHYGSSLYCDTKKWIDNEWIDYITPQAYFALDYSIASFASLCDWWSAVCRYKTVNLYMGMGYYKSRENDSAGWHNNPDEILYELRYANENGDIDGICIYQYKYLSYDKSKDCMKKLVSSYWTSVPKSPKTEKYESYFNDQSEVQNVKFHQGNGVITMTWDKLDGYTRYAIYQYNGTLDINNPKQVVGYAGEIENNKCGITLNDFDDYDNYAIIPLSPANTFGKIKEVQKTEFSPIDLKIGEVSLYVNRPVAAGGNAVIILNSISQNLGSDVKYKVIGSYTEDFQESFELYAETEYFGSQVIRYKFNDIGKATYIKIVCTNNVGTFESDVYLQCLDDDATTISKYIYSYVNAFYEDLFGE